MGDQNVLQPVEEIAGLRRELVIRDVETAEKREKLDKATSTLIASQSQEIAELRRELAEKTEESKKSSIAFDTVLTLKNREISDLKEENEKLSGRLEEAVSSMGEHEQKPVLDPVQQPTVDNNHHEESSFSANHEGEGDTNNMPSRTRSSKRKMAAPVSNGDEKRMNYPPLIPKGCASALEGTQNFQSEFIARHANNNEVVSSGLILPSFFTGSLQDAITEAFDCPGRPDSERRPLALYINHEGSIARNVFPVTVMCSEVVQQCISQFIMWPWDVTEKENEEKLIQWLCECSFFDALAIVTSYLEKIGNFPVLILFSKKEGQLKMIDRINVNASPEQTMEGLLRCMDEFESSKVTMEDNGETTANVNTGSEGNSDHINLKVVGQDSDEVHFRMKCTNTLRKLKKTYADKQEVSVDSLKFLIDGRTINDNDTPTSLELNEGDVIEVHQNSD